MAAEEPAFTFLPLGAILQTFVVDGINIVQGFPTQEDYEKYNAPYFGETIGRVANRISNARLENLNGGKTYSLAANNGVNNLHGGVVGWGKRVWEGPEPVGIRDVQVPGFGGLTEGGESVEFAITSEDGDEGFPGEVRATCVYTTGKQHTEDGKDVTVLGIEYEAKLVGGADETVINMTNHSYFNLTGGPSIAGTEVTLATSLYLPVDAGGIPTGGPTTFPNSIVQADKSFTLGPTEPDIDDCFVLPQHASATAAASVPTDTRNQPLVKVVTAYHPDSGIHLEVWTTEPAFQFYTGKYIDVPALDHAGYPARGKRSGFCVEPSRFVNACNVEEWKRQMLLKKGETYGCRIVYRAWKD